MAPKKGGGGGSSYSYGGGPGGGSDSGYTSSWLEKNRLPGSGWHDGILVTSVVFAGILMIGLWAIATWNLTVKKRASGSRLISTWYSFKLALLVAVAVYTFEFIHYVLQESQTLVAYCYYIIQGIIFNFEYLAQIALLTTIYTVFVYLTRSYDLANSSLGGYWKVIHVVHFCFCGLLGTIWLALLGYKIALIVEDGPDPFSFYYNGHKERPYFQLGAAYYILYMLASMEALALSVFFFMKKTALHVPKLVLILLPALVTFPLMIRSVWEAAIVIRSNLQRRSSTAGAYLAEQILYMLCSLTVYGGIVFIVRLIEADYAADGQGVTDQYGNGVTPSVWPNKEGDGIYGVTHPGPPQYHRYVQPGTQQYPQQHGNGYPQVTDPGQMHHGNRTSPVKANGDPPPVGQASPYGQLSPLAGTYGQANSYPGTQPYGQQPQQLAGGPMQQQIGELHAGQPVPRPGELPVG